MLHNWGYNNKQIDRYDGREYSNLPDIDDDYLFVLQNLVNKKKGCVENVDDPELMLFLGDLVNFENSFGFVSKRDGTCNFIAYERLTDSWGTQIKGKTKEQARREVKDEGKRVENNADMVEISNSLDENSEGKIQDNDDDLEVVGEKRTDENQDDGGIVEGGCGSTDVERGNREGSMTLTKNVSRRGRKKGSVMKIDGGRFEKGGKRRAQHSPRSFNRKKRCLTKNQDYVHEKGTRCSTRKPKFMHDSGEVEPELLAYKGMSFSRCYDTYLEHSVVEGDSTEFAYNERKHNCCDNDVDASSDSDVEVIDKAPNCTEKKYTPVADTEVLHALTEEDDLQCTGERKQTENPQFRKEVEHLLREPYNKEEYERLWSDVNSRKLMEGHKELRGGSIKTYPKDKTGKSYLDHYFDLHGPLNDFKDDLSRKLNVLRGFFYYMKHMSGDGIFKPWLDKSCLSIAPGSE